MTSTKDDYFDRKMRDIDADVREADARERSGGPYRPRRFDSIQGKSEMTSSRELAALVIQVLDTQRRYFKTRSKDDLIASKALEGELRKRALAILADNNNEGAEE